jgi:hypothetical protein
MLFLMLFKKDLKHFSLLIYIKMPKAKKQKEINNNIFEPTFESTNKLVELTFESTNKLVEPTFELTNKLVEPTFELTNKLVEHSLESTDKILQEDVVTIKKRGRKPKGGKIIQQTITTPVHEYKTNIILHLKCSLKDLQDNWDFTEGNVDPYCPKNELNYDVINNNKNNNAIKTFDEESTSTSDNEVREIWKKLKMLQHNLHMNNVNDKKSSCFWCTYDFGNPPVYIPKHEMKGTYHVYGCFCSPECAVAFLMNENIDSSTKFERYYLINYIYSKIYNYNNNIKPAPNPHYMLEKYYGNLTIQEYRSLFKNESLYLVLDKPLTRTLPELYEDNDEFIINNKLISSNTYNTKKKKTKNNILNDNFGISPQH